MTPAELLEALTAAGVMISLRGSDLIAAGTTQAKATAAELLAQARERKAILITTLMSADDQWFAQLEGRLNNGARHLWSMERRREYGAAYDKALYLFERLKVTYEYAWHVRAERMGATA
jgi:hypothetical protein